jgi:hypothetical protein
MLLLSNILVLQPKNAQENKFEENVPHHQTLFFIDQGLEDSLQARESSFRRRGLVELVYAIRIP